MMDLVTAGLVGQLIAVVGLAVLVALGPPRPARAVRMREDGRTEYVDDDSGKVLWRLLTRGLMALFACSALLGISGVARG
jgi:hypothetical protein